MNEQARLQGKVPGKVAQAGQKAVFLKVPYRSGKSGGTLGDVRFAFRQECEANRAGGCGGQGWTVLGDAIRRCDMACCSLSLSSIFFVFCFFSDLFC